MTKRLFVMFLLPLLLSSSSPRWQTLALLGDVMLGRGVSQARAGDWEAALQPLAPHLKTASLALANLESPLTEAAPPAPRPGVYNLCAPASASRALTAAGIDLLALGNNHTRDCHQNNGPAETARILQEAGLRSISPGFFPTWQKLEGLNLALFSFDDIITPLDVDTAAQAIRQANQQGGWVIVSIHWGTEYQPKPGLRQQMLAQRFADAGARLVWGHHPHVLQPLTSLQGAGQPFRTLVAYSLGNALFDQPLPRANRAALLLVAIDSQAVRSLRVLPFEIDPWRGKTTLPDSQINRQIFEQLGLDEYGLSVTGSHPAAAIYSY